MESRFQTAIEKLGELADERGWLGVDFYIENRYPAWEMQTITDWSIHSIPDWVLRRVNVILKSNIPVKGFVITSENSLLAVVDDGTPAGYLVEIGQWC